MTGTFGDLARQADEHLAAAVNDLDGAGTVSDRLSSAAVAAAAAGIGRVSAIMSSYIAAAGDDRPDTHPWLRSAINVRAELLLAAETLPGHDGGDSANGALPVFRHLVGVVEALTDGRDLLGSHSGVGPGDAALARSLWAASVPESGRSSGSTPA